MDTRPLIELVNAQLAHDATMFRTAMGKHTGPFSEAVYGYIEGHPFRLDFFVDPRTDWLSVSAFDQRKRQVIAEPVMAVSWAEAIEVYPWTAALAAAQRGQLGQ